MSKGPEKRWYDEYRAQVQRLRSQVQHPLTYTEKVLFSHLCGVPDRLVRGETQLKLRPDRVAMQDATAQMALLQFMVTGMEEVKVPVTVHCDHLIRARHGAAADLEVARGENREVYDFLKSASSRYGIGFWEPGSGIIHQVVLEQYAFPGGLMIGTDSHTPNAGGLGMAAIGVGGADAVDVMAGGAWGLTNPRLVGVKLTGALSGWASPKDVILKVAGLLTVKGGTGRILEYFGPGTASISATGKATITNMGAELGATTSLFPYDDRMAAYLRQTERSDIADAADQHGEELRADVEVEKSPERFFDEVIEIDLNSLRPQWVGPHTPDLLREVSEMREAVKENDYPDDIRYALIGSCTNSSYEDISRAAHVAKQALDAGLTTAIPLMVTPGSDQVYQTVKRDGYIELFEKVGATVLANACGPCIGQWSRSDIKPGERNTIITSYNRNFRKRNDGNEATLAFISSPEIVTALAFSGKLSFDPLNDAIELAESERAEGPSFTFQEPSGEELPPTGFAFSRAGLVEPELNDAARSQIEVKIAEGSERLAFLEPFPAWDGKDFIDLPVLLKARGKCTTDHISQAGPWLKYRGHLANISDNMFLGATNDFSGETGKGRNVITNEGPLSFPEVAKQYKAAGVGWVVVGDENYGEGSSREHAAMSPRYLGCKAVIVRSFARIHETNLKKQGILALTFVDPDDYDAIQEHSRISILGLENLEPFGEVFVQVRSDGDSFELRASHTMSAEQIQWFYAGSALNRLRDLTASVAE